MESTCTIEFGTKIWKNSKGKRHRIDGPAIEDTNGRKEYWYKDEQISKKKFYSDEFQVRMVMKS
jgi:hypothetical protein